MVCLLFLKFIRECEDAHYEYLLKHKNLYKGGAFFIDFYISCFGDSIITSYRYQQYEETEEFRRLIEQCFIRLVEEFIEFLYKDEDDIDFFNKSYIIKVHELPQNFIQVIKESGFTPPVSI